MTGAVWIVPAYPWIDQPVGGTYYRTQATALARLGLRITVACPTPWAPWPLPLARPRWKQYANAPAREREAGVDVVRPRYLSVPGEPRWAVPERLIARAAWRTRSDWLGSGVVHGHSAITALAAWRLARKTGLPLALTFHGSDLNVWPDRNPGRIPDLRAAVAEAQLVTTVSAALAERLGALTGTLALVLPLGSDRRSLEARAMDREEARASLGIRDDRIVVLFVGNLLPSKGVRELVDAIHTLDGRYLGVLVGDGPLRGYGLDAGRTADAIVYLGSVPHAAVARHMSAADVLVLPSHREGLPTVLVEAGLLGLPVIASAVGGIPELLGRNRGTILGETTAAAIGEALAAFAADRQGARAAADRLRTYVRHEHDADLNAARLLDEYRRIGVSLRGNGSA